MDVDETARYIYVKCHKNANKICVQDLVQGTGLNAKCILYHTDINLTAFSHFANDRRSCGNLFLCSLTSQQNEWRTFIFFMAFPFCKST